MNSTIWRDLLGRITSHMHAPNKYANKQIGHQFAFGIQKFRYS